MKKQIGFLLYAVVLIMAGCDAQEGSVNKAEAQKDYVQLAKEFEEGYLYKTRVLAEPEKNPDSLLLSEQRLKEIKKENSFDKQKIAAFRDSVFLVAKQYGVTRDDISLDEYFYINQRTGEIRSIDFFHKLYAYIKYTREQEDKQQRKLDKLERKYIPKIKQTKDTAELDRLINEFNEKRDEIKNSN